jgi:Domain of unknown function (DUF4307)
VPIPRPAPEQRKWWIVGGVGVTIGVALATWFGISATAGITWTDTGHHVVNAREVQTRFDVTDPERGPVRCTVIALSERKAVVGRRTVDLAPSRFDSTRHTVTIRTAERAVAASVDECVRAGAGAG